MKIYFTISISVYIVIILLAILLLIIEPNGFDARTAILPFIILLFASSLGIGNKFASKTENKALKVSGTLAFAILLTFLGLFVVAAVGWFLALGHAQ